MRRSILIICSLILFSCQNSDLNELTTVYVNVLQDDFKSLKERIVIDKIIQLDSSIPIGKIRKLIIHESNLYVLDKSKDEIICFDIKGELIYSISSKGRGPEEYASIQNFFIDNINNELVILSSDSKVLKYSAISGNLLNTSKIDNHAMILDGTLLSKDVFAWYVMGPHYNLEIKSSASSKLVIPFIEARDMTFSEKAFSARDGYALFAHGTCDYIYKVDKDTVTPHYYIDFGNYKIAQELYENPEQAMAMYEKQDVATKLDYIVDNDNYLCFSYMLFPKASFNVKDHHSIYSKKEKKCYNFSRGTYLFPVYGCTKESFISIIPPVKINSTNESDIDSKVLEFIKLNNIQEDANPLIVFWSLNL